MIDFIKYNLDKNDLEFVLNLYASIETRSEVTLQYKDYSFLVEPCGEKIILWHCGNEVARYDCLDDMLLQFKLDDKSFIEQIAQIDYAD